MSDQPKHSTAHASNTKSRKATVVRVIRGHGDTSGKSESTPSVSAPQPMPERRAKNDTETIHKVANKSSRKKFRDFTVHNSRIDSNMEGGMRMARGPYFPLATSLRFASFFYILGRLSIVATVASLVWLTFDERQDYMVVAPALVCAILFTFIAWGMSNGLRCRVCTMPFLSKRKCKMHRKAAKLPIVSHHFTVALHILTHNHPRCPYCGTTNRLKQ